MADASPNGWPLLAKASTRTFTAAGRRFRVAPGVVPTFAAFLERYAAEVEPFAAGQLDDWGWADRPQRGSTSTPSNHWSGTAIDINALDHVRGVHATFSPAQLERLRDLLADFPVLRWGGDYRSVVDDMHFEVNVTPRVLAEWASRNLSAAAAPRHTHPAPGVAPTTTTPTPTPQEDDDVVTPDDINAIAQAVTKQVWAGRLIAVQHPHTGQVDTVTMETALGRAASVLSNAVNENLLYRPTDLAELRGTILEQATGQDSTEPALTAISKQLAELLAAVEALLHTATTPVALAVAGTEATATPVELLRQAHARSVQVASLIAGVKSALDVLAVAAAKGNVPTAQALQDAMLETIQTTVPRVLLPAAPDPT